MSSEWNEMELGSFINLKRGYDLPQKDRHPGIVPIVSSSGESGAHNSYKVNAPGVVTGRYGTIGEVFYVEKDFWPLNTTLYVEDFKGNDPLFVYYFLKTIKYQDYSDKAAVPGINRNHLHTAKIHVPVEIAEQKKIAAQLRTLDKKIELNRQTNQTLEQIAQAIFKSWFVDFDPVKAKIWANENGHDPERAAMCSLAGLPYADDALDHLSPEQQQQLATTAAIFPDTMEESELGEIPSGWRLATLKEIATKIGSGATPSGGKSVYADNGIAQIRSLNVFDGSFSLADLVFITDEQANKLKNVIVESDDVLLNITGASVTRCCIVPPSVLPARVNQHVCIIRADKKSVNSHYIYHSLIYPTGKGLLLSLSQAGATREALTKAHIEGFQILLSDPELMNRFGMIAKSLHDQKHKLDEESASLAQLRDTLLPKLLSGELSVADLPEVVAP